MASRLNTYAESVAESRNSIDGALQLSWQHSAAAESVTFWRTDIQEDTVTYPLSTLSLTGLSRRFRRALTQYAPPNSEPRRGMSNTLIFMLNPARPGIPEVRYQRQIEGGTIHLVAFSALLKVGGFYEPMSVRQLISRRTKSAANKAMLGLLQAFTNQAPDGSPARYRS